MATYSKRVIEFVKGVNTQNYIERRGIKVSQQELAGCFSAMSQGYLNRILSGKVRADIEPLETNEELVEAFVDIFEDDVEDKAKDMIDVLSRIKIITARQEDIFGYRGRYQ